MSPLEAGFEGAQPLGTFWNLCGFRVPGNDILALDEVQTVLYTHMVIIRFFCIGQQASKFAQKSQGRSNLVASVPKWEWPTQWL